MVKNRKCYACSTEFLYCPDCSKVDALKPRWHSQFCSEQCMTLWTTLSRFDMGMLTKSEAKSIISGLELKSVESYVPCVQRDLAVVLAEDSKPKRSKRKPVEEVETVSQTEEVFTEEQTHEVVKQENE